jgi:signal transduction histidine kinase
MTDRPARAAWHRQWQWQDALLAAGLLAFAWVGIALQQGPVNLRAAGLAVLIVAPLLVRRRWPLGAMVVCLAASACYHLLGYPHELVIPPLVVVLYTVAATGSRRRSLLVAGGTGAVVVVGMAVVGVGNPLEAFGVIGWVSLTVALGEVTRARTALLATMADRAARAERERAAESALRRAEATQREAEARRRVAEERLRIARDLHDVLAHSIAVINAQASVAAHLAETATGQPPGGLATAMGVIAETSRTAMGELRATLDVLRGHDSSITPADELTPAPGMARLDELIESVRSAGVNLTVDTVGEQRPLAPAVDVTAYRIVQESLTNVARHARGSTARLTVEYRRALMRLTVRDDGGAPAEAASGCGYGIVGMTERAYAIGGHLNAGPRAGGGFEVVADLPTQEKDRQ